MASLNEIREERIKKINQLKEQGINPYPISSNKDFSLGEAVGSFDKLSKRKKAVSLVGRVMALRGQGALIFFDFNDGTGSLQGLMKKDEAKESDRTLFAETVDVGDFIEVSGSLFLTKRKEKTLLVKKWKMLSKSLRPLPDKWHGLQDVEERFRRRYLDTLMSSEVRERFVMRSKIIASLRSFLNKEGFIEVETPILQSQAGGANAEAFLTHHNALDIDLYLRIAPELYLKELLVGGFNKVYEIGRLFRNEGIDATHNPEFTTIELYESYSDADTHMKFVEKILKNVVKESVGKTSFEYDGNKISVSKSFLRVGFLELLKRYALIENPTTVTRDELKLKATQLGVDVASSDAKEKIMDNIYKKVVRPKLIQPTFIVDYPSEFSPLAKRKDDSPELIDRYQLVLGGLEVMNAFSELNDPIDQAGRFALQEKNKEAGDKEAQATDAEFIEAMEYGMPPAAGFGMSMDRLTMLLTDTKNIKEVLLFPTMKPRG